MLEGSNLSFNPNNTNHKYSKLNYGLLLYFALQFIFFTVAIALPLYLTILEKQGWKKISNGSLSLAVSSNSLDSAGYNE